MLETILWIIGLGSAFLIGGIIMAILFVSAINVAVMRGLGW